VFGMRYISRGVLRFETNTATMIVIRDLSPRRYLRTSEEERDESNATYQAMNATGNNVLRWPPGREAVPVPPARSTLKCVPFPAGIDPYWSAMLLISEDGIVYVDDRYADFEGGTITLHLFTI